MTEISTCIIFYKCRKTNDCIELMATNKKTEHIALFVKFYKYLCRLNKKSKQEIVDVNLIETSNCKYY